MPEYAITNRGREDFSIKIAITFPRQSFVDQSDKIKVVKTPKGTIHYSSKQDYLNRSQLKGKSADALKKVGDAPLQKGWS